MKLTLFGSAGITGDLLADTKRKRQSEFAEAALSDIGEQERTVMEQCFHVMNENIDNLIREK